MLNLFKKYSDKMYSKRRKILIELVKIGANIVTPPKLYPEYGPYYYAVYFKDLEGIKYEIVCKRHE